MKFGISTYPFSQFPDVRTLVDFVHDAEHHGFSFVGLPEHTIFPTSYERTMGSMWYEAITLASYLAALTSTIRLEFSVLVLPQHDPIYLAKQLATLDVLSGGRVDVGIGVGWLREELETLGADLHSRAARTEEFIAAMRALWTSDPAEFHGQFVSFTDASFHPKPIQSPHPPIFVGGTWRHSARRAAAIGDGWMPQTETHGEFEAALELFHSELTQNGRSVAGFPIQRRLPMWEASREAREHALQAGTQIQPYFKDDYDAAIGFIRANEELGVTHLRLELRATYPENLEQMHAFAANVLAKLTG
jgi:probable F420-dependent oxidoreductase